TPDVENESKPVQAVAATETKNPGTAESIESGAVNVRMNKNDGGKPKIITLEEMFNEIELEKVQLVDTEDSGGDQQNVELPPAVVEIKVSKADHKSVESRELDALNVQMDESDSDKPKIVSFEEMFVPKMFNEIELEKVQHVDTEDSGTDQQNVELPPAVVEIKVSKAGHKSAESRELEADNVQMDETDSDKPKIVSFEEMFVPTAQQNLESMLASKNAEAKESNAVNVQKSEIYNFDRHAITVASDVEHFEDESKTNVIIADQKQLKNEAVEIQEEEKPMSKNDSLLLGTVSMNVKTESGDEVESKVPQDEVIEEESISDVATFEMDQKVQSETAIVESKVHNESESDKNKVFADDVDAEK
uniref:Uncharacterized protein n=1 Tax=Panagrolaimus sp. PS1159 TaxID=55785 RepID=A0AC35G3U1_9BILA